MSQSDFKGGINSLRGGRRCADECKRARWPSLNQLVVGSIPTRPTISLKNNKFLDIASRKLEFFPHGSKLPPFNSRYLVELVI